MRKVVRIAGVDEVGRGCLAGPVYAAAVILDPDHDIEGLVDSKKLSEKKRQQLEKKIKVSAISWCIAYATAVEIDKLNILQASLLAMRRAVNGLDVAPDKVLVDGNQTPNIDYPVKAIIKGDTLHQEISAASILAKQARDAEMVRLSTVFPVYNFAQHKGYPTRQHVLALQAHGICDQHRRSFSPVSRLCQTSH